MKYFILLFLFNFEVRGETFLKDFSTLHRLIAKDEIDKLTVDGNQPIPGILFTPFIASDDCSDEDKEKETNQTQYEVLFIGQAAINSNTNTTSSSEVFNDGIVEMGRYYSRLAFRPEDRYMRMNEKFNTNFRRVEISGNYSKQSILRDAQIGYENYSENERHNQETSTDKVYKEKYKWRYNTPFDAESQMGMELVVERLILSLSQEKGSDEDMIKKMAQGISQVYENDDSKYRALNTLMSRLYSVYNDARNPAHNNKENNPDNKEIPKGSLSFKETILAAKSFDEFGSGVCNDISESVAKVAEQVFPNKDVLVINSGSHFNLAITDGVNTRVLDGPLQIRMQNDLMLDTNSSVTNLHINKIVNGKLAEIALVDTQVGQVSEAMFNTGKKLMKTSTDVHTVISQFKMRKTHSGSDYEQFSSGVGYAKLNNSHLVMVVAKIEASRGNLSGHFGLGASAQMFPSPSISDRDSSNRFQIELRGGTNINVLHYQNPNVELRIDSGLEASGKIPLYADLRTDEELKKANEERNFGDNFSWAVEWVNRLSLNLKQSGDNPGMILTNVQTRNVLGPDDWGAVTGLSSKVSADGVLQSIPHFRFYLNQINADISAVKPISSALEISASSSYMGSNVGQQIRAVTGLTVKAPDGAEIMIFVGYENNKIPGFMTQNSILFGTQGATMGGEIKTKQGPKIKARFRGIGSQQLEGNLGVEIPIDPVQKKQ